MGETQHVDIYDEDEGVLHPRPLPPSRQERAARRTKIILVVVLVAILSAIIAALAFYPVISSGMLGQHSFSSSHPGEMRYLFAFPPDGQQGMKEPSSLAISDDGRIYVADPTTHEIRVFASNGKQLFAFGAIKDGKNDHLVLPVHVSVAGSQVLVSDRKLANLYLFDLDGHFLSRFIRPTADWAPIGATLDADGRAYVTDIGNRNRHQVQLFDRAGLETLRFGVTGEVNAPAAKPGAFFYPYTVLPHGDLLFVADSDNGRVQVFTSDGRFKYIIPTGGVPRGMAFDPAGHLLVVDSLNCRIDVYSVTGEQLGTLGSSSDFLFPNDIAVDKNGVIYVADRGGERVKVWGSTSSTYSLSGALPQVRWAWFLLAIPLFALPPLLLTQSASAELSAPSAPALVGREQD